MAPTPGKNNQYVLQEPATMVFITEYQSASRTVLRIVWKLSRMFRFNYVSSRVYYPFHLVNQAELGFIEEFHQRETPLFYARHLHYVDFERYNFRSPVYINLVREPFDRLVSAYYYLQETKVKSNNSANMTFDECVEKRLIACVRKAFTFQQVPFFCGLNPICRMPSKEAVIRAKHKIVRQYLVIGTTENMAQFFEALEVLLPNFFKNAPKLFRNEGSILHDKSRGKIRKETTTKSRDALVTDLMYDTELYKWTRQRFYTLYKKVMNGKR